MANSSKNTMVQLLNIKKGAYKNVEGKRILLPAKGHLQDTLTEMEQDLQSAIPTQVDARLRTSNTLIMLS